MPSAGPKRPRIRVLAGGETVASAESAASADFTPHLDLTIPAERRRFWSPQDPFLYDLEIELCQRRRRGH